MAGVARWALTLTAAAWLVLAAAWAALHGWIVPRIDTLRPALERQAQRVLGVPVRIGALTAHSDGLIPTVELSQVALLDPEGRPALVLPRTVVALSPRSLLRLGFEQIYIEAPELDIRRAGDGRIFIAGMAFRDSGEDSSRAADWLFAQPQVLIRGGTVRFADELRGAPPLALTQLDLLLASGGWRHGVRLDATPPPEWGERFSLRGQFRQPLLSIHPGRWQQWSGQLYAEFPRVDASRLSQHVDLGTLRVGRGAGSVRAWADVRRGEVTGGVVDMALAEVEATLGADLRPLALHAVTGRAGGRRLEQGFEVETRALQFSTADGLHWPGGDLLLRHLGEGEDSEGELRADRVDLAALAHVAARLPLGEAVHEALARQAPRGQVERLSARWHGPLSAPRDYQARASVRGLALGAPDAALGLQGADVQLDFNQAGGQAVLAMRGGQLALPDVFEDPLVPVQRLSGTVRWQVAPGPEGRIAVQAPDLRFANADAAGEAQLAWHTGEGAAGRFPGVLELSGRLTRADGTRVHRYLPLAVPREARHYVRDAVSRGQASQVLFRVQGELARFPFADGGPGEFRIAAQLRDVTYAYVPASLQPPGEAPWPALTGLSGELLFEGAAMMVRGASGGFAGQPRLAARGLGARIADLEHPVVDVAGTVRGPLADMLAVVRRSPVAALTDHALDAATATGGAELALGLVLPVAELGRSTVRGSVALAGNDVRIVPESPLVGAARGTVRFTESGFTLAGVQGRALGGEVRLEGGLHAGGPAGTGSALRLQAQGTATAEGLRDAGLPEAVGRIARHASGSAAYALTLGARRDVAELLVTSDLRGLALQAPAPLVKAAATPLALRVERRLTAEAAASAEAPREDELLVDLGEVARLHYQRALDEDGDARVLRGAIALGEAALAPPPLPAAGVSANAVFERLDADAWLELLQDGAPAAAAAVAAATVPVADPAHDYLPTRLGLRAGALAVQGRTLHQVVAGISRQGEAWRANVDARELNGYVEWQDGTGAGGGPAQPRLRARLARLALPETAETRADDLLLDSRPPETLPALDIAVQDFELRGRRLGRLEIEARNRQGPDGRREWQLARFNLAAPEAQLSSSGRWTLLPGSGGAEARGRTALDFRLDVHDSGALLARFDMPGVLRRGRGRIEGEVGWRGSPLSPDYPSMGGQMHVEMEAGQFLKAEPGLAKLLSVLSLQSLPRRLALDFRDVFSEGFAFDFVRGDVRIARGVAHTNNLQMKGVNAAVLMEGQADLAQEMQDLHVVVVPEINAMTASLVATAINPVIGLSSFLAQVFLRGPLIQAATQEFRIDGTWDEPRVQRVPRGSRPAGPPTPPSRQPGDHP